MENSITQMLVKKSLFVTNKVFREQLTSHNIDWNMHVKISLSRTNVVSHDFINIIDIRQTCDKPRNRRVFK